MKLSVILLGLLVSCGEDTSSEFGACGGNVVGSWNITGAKLSAALDGCPVDGAVSGFLVFNENKRVSVNLEAAGWKTPGDAACGQKKQYGAFWRTNGTSVCMALAESDLDAACAGNAPAGDGWAGLGEYCVSGSSLQIRSSDLFGLSGEAIVSLGPMP
ncbi:MAG: hypothetical protein HY791_03475 [Deltaproteobacteria bacterium]|nr:hypothetical protein [Deltaproteobacteria bacterium]